EFVHKASRDELRRRGWVAVGRIVREAIAARVAAKAELTYLREVAGFPGFPRALTDTIEEVRLNRREVSGDLALLLSGYERELRERGFADHATRVEIARTNLPARFRGTAVVLLDVAVRTAAEQELVAELKRAASAVLELQLGAAESDAGRSL